MDPSAASNTMTTPPSGKTATFVVQIDTNGVFDWADYISGSFSVKGSLEYISNDEIISSGGFAGTVDFNSSATINNLSSPNASTISTYVTRLSSTGSYVWASKIDASLDNSNISLDQDDNVYVVGGAPLHFTKLKDDGSLEYNSAVNNTVNMYFTNGFVGFDGNIIVSGGYKGSVDLDLGTGTNNKTAAQDWDAFTMKLKTKFNVGIKDINYETLTIYPNPSNNILNIKHGIRTSKKVIILDLTGKIVEEISGNVNSLDLSGLTNGMYLLQVDYGTSIGTTRFIKN